MTATATPTDVRDIKATTTPAIPVAHDRTRLLRKVHAVRPVLLDRDGKAVARVPSL